MADLYISYIKSIPGILKLVEILLSFIVMICASVGSTATVYFYYTLMNCHEGTGFTVFTAVMALIVTAVFLVLVLLRMHESQAQLKRVWTWLELGRTGTFMLLYFISMVVAAIAGDRHQYNGWARKPCKTDAWIATAVFCAFAMIAFAVEFGLHFLQWRRSREPTTVSLSGGHQPTPVHPVPA